MKIRTSNESDNAEIEKIHLAAFGDDEGPVIVDLVNRLFVDTTAAPLLSQVAVDHNRVIGHILFTRANVTQTKESVSASILAPLAVHPDAQNKGIGARLIKRGLQKLKGAGVDLVFVLGHPGYYPRCGFTPAGELGFEAPYPIAEENAGAWMVQALKDGIIGKIKGKVQCSEVLNRPEYWQE